MPTNIIIQPNSGKCQLCGEANSFDKFACCACGARLPWANTTPKEMPLPSKRHPAPTRHVAGPPQTITVPPDAPGSQTPRQVIDDTPADDWFAQNSAYKTGQPAGGQSAGATSPILPATPPPLPGVSVPGTPPTITIQQATLTKPSTIIQMWPSDPQSANSNLALTLGLLGSSLMFIGVFCPLITVPILGSFNYLNNGVGGKLVLALAAGSFVLTLMRLFRGVLAMGVAGLVVLIHSFVTMQSRMAAMEKELHEKVGNNLFGDFAEAAVRSSTQMQWGWGVLFIGAALLIAAAALSESKPDYQR